MTQQGIKITDLRAEVQTLVNSDPTKYDPNKNGKIEEGDELSQLLSEYQCKPEDLTSNDGKKMWTLNEQIAANEYAAEKAEQDETGILATTLGIGAGAITAFFSLMSAANDDTLHEVKTKKLVDIEKLVNDGSYNTGARPAYDVGTYMKQYIS